MLKRLNYLTHRWIGIVLGILVFVWFGSGIVMMYYPYPVLTESQQMSLLHSYEPTPDLVGFRRAIELYSGGFPGTPGRVAPPVVAARLELWDGRLVYRLFREGRRSPEDVGLVDGRTGRVLTPISAGTAAQVARAVVGPAPSLAGVDLLPRSDHYFMGGEHRASFPVYRVRFNDDDATAVYVSRNSGALPAVATRVTRITTWFGTVPHWLYFMWLYYDHPAGWYWVNLILPGIGVALALTGITLGVYQLFPRRARGQWRISGYHGMSLWHHVAGVICGLLVLTWALSGLLEIPGATNDPQPGQAALARGGPLHWEAIRISEATAMARLRRFAPAPAMPRAIDLAQFGGRLGYKFTLDDGRSYWVDATNGDPRGELAPQDVARCVGEFLGPSVHVASVDRINRYDSYYYARHGREMHLPAWRVHFDDPHHSVLYLDTVSGAPVGFVDADVRAWRWWRDGLHDLDFPGLNNRRPQWDLVVLPLMIAGLISAVTGVWLLVRRLKRILVD